MAVGDDSGIVLHAVAVATALAFSFATAMGTIAMAARSSGASVWLALPAMLAGACAAWLLSLRNTYLPFLGSAVLPPSLLRDVVTPPDANVRVRVDVPGAADGARVLYWAAAPASGVQQDPATAYGDYHNAGVALVKGGGATLALQCPAEYEVPSGRKLSRHVHYRVQPPSKALLGPVRTTTVEC